MSRNNKPKLCRTKLRFSIHTPYYTKCMSINVGFLSKVNLIFFLAVFFWECRLFFPVIAHDHQFLIYCRRIIIRQELKFHIHFQTVQIKLMKIYKETIHNFVLRGQLNFMTCNYVHTHIRCMYIVYIIALNCSRLLNLYVKVNPQARRQ